MHIVMLKFPTSPVQVYLKYRAKYCISFVERCDYIVCVCAYVGICKWGIGKWERSLMIINKHNIKYFKRDCWKTSDVIHLCVSQHLAHHCSTFRFWINIYGKSEWMGAYVLVCLISTWWIFHCSFEKSTMNDTSVYGASCVPV